MKKLLFILLAGIALATNAALAQSRISVYDPANAQRLLFSYEYRESGGNMYVYFYKGSSISDSELIIHYRIDFHSNRTSQTRMATILASGSSDHSPGYGEPFRIAITNWEVKGGGAYSGSSSSSSSSGSSSESSRITRADVPAEYWVETDVNAASVVWAEANVGARNPEDFGNYIYARHMRGRNMVCPNGWRPPTTHELRSLARSRSKWTTVNGVQGRLFYTGSQEVFLPAAGYENGIDGGKKGYYRTDTGVSGEDELWTLIFDKGRLRVKGFNKGSSASLRCVKGDRFPWQR